MYDKLRRDASRGVRWAFLSSVSVRLFQVLATLVLAKLLVPADFGLFSLASIVTNALALFPDIGFAQVLIYQQGDIRRSANTAFVLSLATGIVLAVTLFSAAPALSRLFSEPLLIAPMRVMAVSLVIMGLANVPQALLEKELQFKRRALPEVLGAFTYALASVGLAAAGCGVWSMVVGWVIMSAVGMLTAWMVCSWRPSFEFHSEESRVIVSYGKHLMIATLAAFIFLQIDKAAVGKWLGVTALGFYSIAFTVCNLPATNLTAVVNRVMFPTYSKLQHDLPEIGRVYVRTIRLLSVAAFPVAAGMIVVSGPLIRVLYGAKWTPAIPLFYILAIYGLIRAIGATAGAVFMAVGYPELIRRLSLIQLTAGTLLVYPVALRYDVAGVAVLFTVAYLAGTLYGLVKVQRILDIPTTAWMRAMTMPFTAAVLSGIAAWKIGGMEQRQTWLSVIASGATLSVVYGAAVLIMDRRTFGELRDILVGSKNTGGV